MKTSLIFLTLLSTAVLWPACKNTKYTASNLPDRQLRWGSDNTMSAGVGYNYILLDNGQIFLQYKATERIKELGKTKGKKAKALFEMIEPLGLEKLKFYYPGSSWNFIEVYNDGKKNRITWGAKDKPIDPKIKDLFNQLSELPKSWMWRD